MDSPDPQTDGRLAVREEDDAFFVVRAGAPDDWLASFSKRDGFPAREWAENMARVYNRRLAGLAGHPALPPTPPGTRPGSYHPDP